MTAKRQLIFEVDSAGICRPVCLPFPARDQRAADAEIARLMARREQMLAEIEAAERRRVRFREPAAILAQAQIDLRFALARHDRLEDWEAGFVASMARWPGKFSDKQCRRLAIIAGQLHKQGRR